MVLIDKEGVIIFRSVSDLPIGCGIGEALMIVKQANESNNTANPDDKSNSSEKKTNHKNEKNEANNNKSLLEMFDIESKLISETGEKPRNSSTIADEVNLKDDVTGKKPNDK